MTNAFLIKAYSLGIGRHLYYVPVAQVPDTFKFLWMAEPTNLFALYFVRLSISLTFLRIIPSNKTGFRMVVWSTIAGLTASDIYVSVTYFIQCIPIQKVWEPDSPGWCLNDAAYQAGPWTYQGKLGMTHTILHVANVASNFYLDGYRHRRSGDCIVLSATSSSENQNRLNFTLLAWYIVCQCKRMRTQC